MARLRPILAMDSEPEDVLRAAIGSTANKLDVAISRTGWPCSPKRSSLRRQETTTFCRSERPVSIENDLS